MDAKFVTSYGKYGLNGFVINYVNLVFIYSQLEMRKLISIKVHLTMKLC